MAKNVSADTLLKRLQKIERAQARLGDITTRIRAQADTLSELLVVAQGFVAERAAVKPTSRTRSTTPAGKTTAARRPATKRAGTRPAAATTGTARAAGTAPAPRRAASV